MKRFPNGRVRELYLKIQGKEFTHSPVLRYFADRENIKDYDYWSMIWLLENGYLFEQPWDINKGWARVYSTVRSEDQ